MTYIHIYTHIYTYIHPLVNIEKKTIEHGNMAIEIVDLSIRNGEFSIVM